MLPTAERERLYSQLELVPMSPGRVLYESSKLQSTGLIRYSRGRITVLDRPGLEAHTCGCYAVVRKELARLLPDVTAL